MFVHYASIAGQCGVITSTGIAELFVGAPPFGNCREDGLGCLNLLRAECYGVRIWNENGAAVLMRVGAPPRSLFDLSEGVETPLLFQEAELHDAHSSWRLSWEKGPDLGPYQHLCPPVKVDWLNSNKAVAEVLCHSHSGTLQPHHSYTGVYEASVESVETHLNHLGLTYYFDIDCSEVDGVWTWRYLLSMVLADSPKSIHYARRGVGPDGLTIACQDINGRIDRLAKVGFPSPKQPSGLLPPGNWSAWKHLQTLLQPCGGELAVVCQPVAGGRVKHEIVLKAVLELQGKETRTVLAEFNAAKDRVEDVVLPILSRILTSPESQTVLVCPDVSILARQVEDKWLHTRAGKCYDSVYGYVPAPGREFPEELAATVYPRAEVCSLNYSLTEWDQGPYIKYCSGQGWRPLPALPPDELQPYLERESGRKLILDDNLPGSGFLGGDTNHCWYYLEESQALIDGPSVVGCKVPKSSICELLLGAAVSREPITVAIGLSSMGFVKGIDGKDEGDLEFQGIEVEGQVKDMIARGVASCCVGDPDLVLRYTVHHAWVVDSEDYATFEEWSEEDLRTYEGEVAAVLVFVTLEWVVPITPGGEPLPGLIPKGDMLPYYSPDTGLIYLEIGTVQQLLACRLIATPEATAAATGETVDQGWCD